MAIEKVLVIEKDTDWQEIYQRRLSAHFPGVRVTCTKSVSAIQRETPEQRFDLYITNYPRVDQDVARPHDALLRRIAKIREIQPDATIALVTGRTGLDALARTLGIDYFPKSMQNLFDNIAAQYHSGGETRHGD